MVLWVSVNMTFLVRAFMDKVWYLKYSSLPGCVSIQDCMKSSGKQPEEAVVDEEAILSLLENSPTFLPLSQTSNHSSLLGMYTTQTSIPHRSTYSSSLLTFFSFVFKSLFQRNIFFYLLKVVIVPKTHKTILIIREKEKERKWIFCINCFGTIC